MTYQLRVCAEKRQYTIQTPLKAQSLLDHPLLNKGTAFSLKERDYFGLHSLLPPVVEDIGRQCQQVLAALAQYHTAADKFWYLKQLSSMVSD
mgnify:CR=1 FL=1